MGIAAFKHEKHYDVVVVSAGFSGLQAASLGAGDELRRLRVGGANRVGRKTLTVECCEEDSVDGASWVNNTNQSEMFKLCKRYGVDTEIQRDHGTPVIQSADGSIAKVPFGQLPTTCSLIDLDNPTKSARAREIDQPTSANFAFKNPSRRMHWTSPTCHPHAWSGVESDEVSALFMLLYFKGGAGIDSIVWD
ncbi:hypothetical protein N7523_010030 [Penicillium sp. IBT 18751x]|nr:hypothetical protein N7523_010030 [Penicillium sp. IBT 18751x]